MSNTLKDWLKFGWLKEHKTSAEEVGDLLAVADRDLSACKTPDLHNDWRYFGYRQSAQIIIIGSSIPFPIRSVQMPRPSRSSMRFERKGTSRTMNGQTRSPRGKPVT